MKAAYYIYLVGALLLVGYGVSAYLDTQECAKTVAESGNLDSSSCVNADAKAKVIEKITE